MDKYRLNRGQEFVIGGYIPGPHGFDSLIVRYYQNKDLIYVAFVRNGFVPALRRQVFERIRGLVSSFYWVHSWWWFRAQTSALQQATPFLGATKREAATIPPMAIRRNTSTLNGTFTGDRCFPSSVVSSDARRGKDIARTCDSEWSHGTAAPVLSALRPTH